MSYIKCPRCELNYMRPNEKHCDVCKAELGVKGYTLLDEEPEINDSWRNRSKPTAFTLTQRLKLRV